MRNVKIPNLPEGEVGIVVVQKHAKTVAALTALGIIPVFPEKDEVLPDEISQHADMLCCFADEGLCILAPKQQRLKNSLEQYGIKTIRAINSPGKNYPEDIILNVAIGDDFALGSFPHTDVSLLNCINNKRLIDVRQGYAKCSTCFVTSKAFITEDTGIANALKTVGADVLVIQSGDIYLSEIHTGFFGGATGKLSKNKLAIAGSLKYHKDGEKIKKFLQIHGVDPIELFDGRITDIGGILPAKEK